MSTTLMSILTHLDDLPIDDLAILKKAVEFRLMSPEERAESAQHAFDSLHESLVDEGWTDEDFDHLESAANAKG